MQGDTIKKCKINHNKLAHGSNNSDTSQPIEQERDSSTKYELFNSQNNIFEEVPQNQLSGIFGIHDDWDFESVLLGQSGSSTDVEPSVHVNVLSEHFDRVYRISRRGAKWRISFLH